MNRGQRIYVVCRAIDWFSGQGVYYRRMVRDNDPAAVSTIFVKKFHSKVLRYIRKRRYSQRNNGKAERLIQIIWSKGLRLAHPLAEDR